MLIKCAFRLFAPFSHFIHYVNINALFANILRFTSHYCSVWIYPFCPIKPIYVTMSRLLVANLKLFLAKRHLRIFRKLHIMFYHLHHFAPYAHFFNTWVDINADLLIGHHCAFCLFCAVCAFCAIFNHRESPILRYYRGPQRYSADLGYYLSSAGSGYLSICLSMYRCPSDCSHST